MQQCWYLHPDACAQLVELALELGGVVELVLQHLVAVAQLQLLPSARRLPQSLHAHGLHGDQHLSVGARSACLHESPCELDQVRGEAGDLALERLLLHLPLHDLLLECLPQ